MLLYIYLGTTAFVWFDTFRHQLYLNRRLKKEGYIDTSNKYFGFGDIVLGGLFLVALSVPVFNLVFPLSHIDKDRSYDEYKNYLLDAGAIEEGEIIKDDNKIQEKIIKIKDTTLKERINQSGHIYYSPMYIGEELDIQEENGYTYKKTLKRK